MLNDRYDEIGKIKEVDEATIFNSSRLIKKGKIFDLGMEINENIPGKKEGIFPFSMLFDITPEDNKNFFQKIDKTSRISGCSEVIISPIHISTHIDSLCHMHLDDKVIGKFDVKEIRTNRGWKRCGAETIPPIAGRGILLDIAKYLGKEKLENEHIITLDEVKNYIKDKKIEIKFGDIVCVRTGKIKDFYKEDYWKSGPGIGSEAAIWLCERGMCVLCIDYNSVDSLPFRHFNDSTHIKMIYENLVYLIEALNLEELSKEDIVEFFMICSSIKITGCSGAFIRPVALI